MEVMVQNKVAPFYGPQSICTLHVLQK